MGLKEVLMKLSTSIRFLFAIFIPDISRNRITTTSSNTNVPFLRNHPLLGHNDCSPCMEDVVRMDVVLY